MTSDVARARTYIYPGYGNGELRVSKGMSDTGKTTDTVPVTLGKVYRLTT
jgi:hypothetical protein